MTLNSEGMEKTWRFDIQHGPEGEAAFAWVYAGKDLVATMRTHHAESVVEAMNRRALPPVDGLEVVAEIEGLIDAYWVLAFVEGREGRDKDTPEDAAQKTRAAISSRLSTLSQASSVIAGLKEANEALMRERTSMIAAHRESIDRLTLKIGVLEAKAEHAARQVLGDHNG